MSNTPVFGSQVTIDIDDGTGVFINALVEVSSFSSKADDVVKKNSSLGETGVGSIDVIHDGGTLSIEAKLTDVTLLAYLFAQDHHHRGSDNLGKRGKTPYVIVKERITFTDDSVLVIKHEGTVLHNLDRSVQSKNDEYIIKAEGTYKKCTIEVEGEHATSTAGHGIAKFVAALTNFDANQSYQDYNYKEIVPVSYLISGIFS